MAVTAVIAAGVSVVQGIQGLAGGNAKDAERLAANQAAYQKALAGDSDAAAFLKYRSGRHGCSTLGGGYGYTCGWATQVAKDDAFAKFNALQGTATVQAGLAEATSSAVDAVENATGRKIVALTPAQWALLIGAGVVLVLVVPKFLGRK
jgi:hypothetical protein